MDGAFAFTNETKPQWEKADFWREVLPSLTVSDDDEGFIPPGNRAVCKPRAVHRDAASSLRRQRLIEDGYVLSNDMKGSSELVEKLRDAISALHQKKIPASFVLMYDETWRLARMANRVLSKATHPLNVFNFDLLAWHIDAKENRAGFSPHRDRQPDDTSSSFHVDGQAKYVTMWMALSEATPENSCLYVIPRPHDPGYSQGDTDEDPLSRALPTKESYQNIRALPRRAGEAVLFTHRILHWGSRGNAQSSLAPNDPRVAISFVASAPSFEQPYIDSNYFPTDGERLPPFRIRLLLVCAQLLIYYQRFDLPKSFIRACYDHCKAHGDDLDPAYKKKVMVEFVKAMKETSEGATKSLVNCNDDNDDKDEDAVLEEMLEAEAGGYGDFHDDFDGLDGAEPTEHDDDDDGFEDNEEDGGIDALFAKQNASKKRKLG